MIPWRYIDTSSATIAAMRDYENMRAIINNTPSEIKELHDGMTSPRRATLTGLPTAHNCLASQDKLAAQIDKLDVLRERYRLALEYTRWFEPAWGALTDTEQLVLREFYMSGNLKSGATQRLVLRLNYSERAVEYLRSNTLRKLRTLLFG